VEAHAAAFPAAAPEDLRASGWRMFLANVEAHAAAFPAAAMEDLAADATGVTPQNTAAPLQHPTRGAVRAVVETPNLLTAEQFCAERSVRRQWHARARAICGPLVNLRIAGSDSTSHCVRCALPNEQRPDAVDNSEWGLGGVLRPCLYCNVSLCTTCLKANSCHMAVERAVGHWHCQEHRNWVQPPPHECFTAEDPSIYARSYCRTCEHYLCVGCALLHIGHEVVPTASDVFGPSDARSQTQLVPNQLALED
jgi:hypothetical protein